MIDSLPRNAITVRRETDQQLAWQRRVTWAYAEGFVTGAGFALAASAIGLLFVYGPEIGHWLGEVWPL